MRGEERVGGGAGRPLVLKKMIAWAAVFPPESSRLCIGGESLRKDGGAAYFKSRSI